MIPPQLSQCRDLSCAPALLLPRYFFSTGLVDDGCDVMMQQVSIREQDGSVWLVLLLYAGMVMEGGWLREAPSIGSERLR